MHGNLFFDLMAELIKEAKMIKPYDVTDSFTKPTQDALVHQVNMIMINVFGRLYTSYDKGPMTSQQKDAIIQKCRDRDDYYLYRAMIFYLDSIAKIDTLIEKYDSLSFDNIENNTEVFLALNDNYDSTGIRMMMRVKEIKVDKSSITGREEPHFDRDADYWTDDINSHLHNTYYEDQTLFKGIEVDNILIKQSDNKKKSTFDIAYVPISNKPIDELLDYNDCIVREDEAGHEIRYFGSISAKAPNEINAAFVEALKASSGDSANLLVSVEMLGTQELCGADEKQINSIYSDLFFDDYNMPDLIVPPSYWRERKNSLSVFSSNGRLLGTQDKATRYKYKGKSGMCDEDLEINTRKIRMWHIPDVGRIVFMICSDFLDADYRRFVASVLKATVIICPAFSAGTREFDLAINSLKEFGTACIWLNCCSALTSNPDPPDYIGLVSTPIVREDGDSVRIKPQCNGKCRQGCYFLIKIPKNAVGNTLTEDLQVIVEHCIERNVE